MQKKIVFYVQYLFNWLIICCLLNSINFCFLLIYKSEPIVYAQKKLVVYDYLNVSSKNLFAYNSSFVVAMFLKQAILCFIRSLYG